MATDGEANILDIEIDGYEQVSSLIAGSKDEVEFIMTTLKC